MRVGILSLLLAPVLLAGIGCRALQKEAGQLDADELAQREAHLAEALKQPAESTGTGKPVARWIMPVTLAEISGLALTPDGRLFAHGDELGQVSELDYRRGVLVKQFTLGRTPLQGDFEGITVADGLFYLLASDGKIYEFREGDNGTAVDYVAHDTRLGKECEFEGITYDADRGALLLVCKNVGTKRLDDDLVIYAWKLPDGASPSSPAIVIPRKEVIGGNKWKSLHPSDITRDPLSGDYVIVTAQEQALVRITPDGKVVSSRPLPAALEHTEGVAITKDSLLILSDEAGKRPAAITVYRWR